MAARRDDVRVNTDCLNPRVRAMSPAAGLSLGLYAPSVTSSSMSTSVAGGLAGLNAAATELARLGDRAPAAAAAAVTPPGLTPWSLSPFSAVGVDTPTDRFCRVDRTGADDHNKNLADYVNKQRFVEQQSMTYFTFLLCMYCRLMFII